MKRKWLFSGAVVLPLVLIAVAHNATTWRPHLVTKIDGAVVEAHWSRDGRVVRLNDDHYVDSFSLHELSAKQGKALFGKEPIELRTIWNDQDFDNNVPTKVCTTATNRCVPIRDRPWNLYRFDSEFGFDVTQLGFSPDTQELWMVGESDIYRWSTATGQLKKHIDLGAKPDSIVATSPDYSAGVAWISGPNYGKNVIFEPPTGRQKFVLPTFEEEPDFRFSPQGNVLCASNAKHQFFDARSGHFLWQSSSLATGGNDILFSPDESLVAIGNDTFIELRDARTGQLKRTLPGSASPLTFSPDGSQLWTSSLGSIWSWRTR